MNKHTSVPGVPGRCNRLYLVAAGGLILVGCSRLEPSEHARDHARARAAAWMGQRQAALALRDQGAVLVRDEEAPGKPVTEVTVMRHTFNDSGMQAVQALTALRKVSVSSTSVTDAGLAALSELTGLTSLDLSETAITDAGLVYLERLKGLQHLDLHQTRVSNLGLEHLRPLSRLNELDLSNTRIDDRGLPVLEALTQLGSVNLNGTQVSVAGARALQGKFPHLRIYHVGLAH